MTTFAAPAAAPPPVTVRLQPALVAQPDAILAGALFGRHPVPSTAPAPTVVVLSGHAAARAARTASLAAAGLRAIAVGTIQAARAAVAAGVGCLVLDRRAPDGDALTLVDELYCTEGAPRMLVVASDGSDRERVGILEAGADDVVPPHVPPSELVARVRRLATPVAAPEHRREVRRVEVGRIAIDQDRRTVLVDGDEVPLSPTQYQILVRLAVEPGRAVPVRALVETCWDSHQEQTSCAVRTQVTRLRRALRGAVEIRCVRGEGYRLTEAEG